MSLASEDRAKIADLRRQIARIGANGKRKQPAKVQHERIKPKGGREQDAGYAAWVHETGLSCIACHIEGPPSAGVLYRIEFAHQRVKGWKKGVRGDDADSCPLCVWHHQLAPNACDKGQRQFWTRLGVDPAQFCADLYAAFRGGRSGERVILEAAKASYAADASNTPGMNND